MAIKYKIYPYNMNSQSAKRLAQGLGVLRVYPDRNCYVKPNNVFINWGNSTYPDWWFADLRGIKWINKPYSVKLATNKLETFLELAGVWQMNNEEENPVPTPPFATNKDVAITWISQGHKVFCRKTLTSHSGQGIVIASTLEELVDAPLYVKAIKKDKEYRVHVAGENIIDFQEKKKKLGYEGGISGIRNHSNGWVYARENIQLPEEVAFQSIKAVKALGLDFGAVDICTEKETNRPFVFEVNTAPGLEGTTLTKYINYFRSLYATI